MNDMKMNRIWVVGSVLLLFISIFGAGNAFSTENVEEDRMILVYKRDMTVDSLRTDHEFDLIADYDDFVLVSTSPEDKDSLMDQGHLVDRLENREKVRLNSYTFDTRDGIPNIPEELRVRRYPEGVRRPYIVQFVGPIMQRWQEQLINMNVIPNGYRHRYNLIMEMESEKAQSVENLEFVNWIGPYHPAYRFDPELLDIQEPIDLEVRAFETADTHIVTQQVAQVADEVTHLRENYIRSRGDPETIKSLANIPQVKTISRVTSNAQFFNHDATWVAETNEVEDWKVTEKGVTGAEQLVTVCDSELYEEHEMFSDPENPIGDDHRKIQEHYSIGGDINEGDYHGTHVSGSVLGDAAPYGTYGDQDGNAIGARLIFQDIGSSGGDLVLPEDMYNDAWRASYDSGSRIHTNSWGGNIGTQYDGLAVTGDEFIWDHKDYNILFAAGNSGSDNRGDAVPHSISQESEGKNIITVGAVNYPEYQDDIADFSSRGYAEDGRIKPTIMQVGRDVTSASRVAVDDYSSMSGTSMSAPGIAGQLAQVRQYYEDGWYPSGRSDEDDGFNPSNALVRATMINGAVEATSSDSYELDERFPNADQGYGRSLLDRVLHFEGDERRLKVFDSWNEEEGLDTGESWETSFHVDDPEQELEVSLAWTDPPGEPGASPAIVNDLDLELSGPDGTRYVGNAFTGYDPGYSQPDPTDNPWSGEREGGFDGLNVEENILLLPEQNEIESGTYELTVSAHNVPEGPQPFAVVISGGIETADPPSIEITSPQGGETWNLGETQSIEWTTDEGDAPIENVDLEYTTDNRNSWEIIDIGLTDDGDYDWKIPDEWTDEARIRATVYDEDTMSSSDISPNFSIRGTEPPEIEITRPTGGEVWVPGDEEKITWDISEGEHAIDRIDLEYTTDYGESWSLIDTDLDGNDYDWIVPADPSQEARIRATVHDVDGYSGEDISDPFVIEDGVQEYGLTIDIEGGGTTDPEEGTHNYEGGEEVIVEATPAEGWTFLGWDGDETGTEPTIEIRMDEDKSIIAVFEEEDLVEYDLTINIVGEGSTDPKEGTHTYSQGDVETVTAIPESGWEFVEWTNDVTDSDPTIEVTIDENKSITAVFEEEKTEFELVIEVEGQGSTQPEEGTHIYEEETLVTVEATPDEDWRFIRWTGDKTGDDPIIEMTMDENKSITAVFEEEDLEFELVIEIEGQGSTQPEEGTHTYEEGVEVTISAATAEWWYFREWTGDHEGTESEITLTMDEDKEITAHFEEIERYSLTVDIEGEGRVELEPEQEEYEKGTEVELRVDPGEGWYFHEWTGYHKGTREVITIVMDEDKSITAHFEIPEYELTISLEGEGTTHPEEGKHTYEEGEEITLSALPDMDWYLAGWTGDATSADEVITITMDGDIDITANFEKQESYFEVEMIEYDDEVDKEEEITITFRSVNTGEGRGTKDIEFYMNGERVNIFRDLTLGPGEEYEGEFSLKGDDIGEQNLEIRSSDTSESVTITVEDDDGIVSNYRRIITALLIGLIAVAVLIFTIKGRDGDEPPPSSEQGSYPNEQYR